MCKSICTEVVVSGLVRPTEVDDMLLPSYLRYSDRSKLKPSVWSKPLAELRAEVFLHVYMLYMICHADRSVSAHRELVTTTHATFYRFRFVERQQHQWSKVGLFVTAINPGAPEQHRQSGQMEQPSRVCAHSYWLYHRVGQCMEVPLLVSQERRR